MPLPLTFSCGLLAGILGLTMMDGAATQAGAETAPKLDRLATGSIVKVADPQGDISGVKRALDALSQDDYAQARAYRDSLKPGTLAHKTVSWAWRFRAASICRVAMWLPPRRLPLIGQARRLCAPIASGHWHAKALMPVRLLRPLAALNHKPLKAHWRWRARTATAAI
ncbi:MAG: hypothetical protein HC779_05520 [Phyllobacteriaceae bacterium]|nr:hypothetical protein [Phyllobacteriaceae bacterium]